MTSKATSSKRKQDKQVLSSQSLTPRRKLQSPTYYEHVPKNEANKSNGNIKAWLTKMEALEQRLVMADGPITE